ncbi:MAG: hypothetical protein Q9218_000167 [Villophora microphyllina]
MWDAYSEGSENSYQGLDQEWMQRSISESENSTGMDASTHPEGHAVSQKQQSQDSRRLRTPTFQRTGKQYVVEEPKGSEAKDYGISSEYEGSIPSSEDGVREEVESGGSHKENIGLDSQHAILHALEQQTEEFLRQSMNSLSSQPRGGPGSPPGVEAAKKAYDQGLLSTKTFHRDCLPPALLCSRIATPSDTTTNMDRLTVPEVAVPSLSPAPSDQRKCFRVDSSNLVVKRRNLSEQQQLRRINQQPLSAIYEEPAGVQALCACNLCSDAASGRGIVWFHLCPRYAAMAQEKGMKYERYEGRVIMHHGPERESIGLIVEGPMEDRFVPAASGELTARAFIEGYINPPESDTSSVFSGANHGIKPAPRAASSEALNSLPDRALERSTGPRMRISQLSPLDDSSSQYGSKKAEVDSVPRLREDRETVLPQNSRLAEFQHQKFQQHIHPALRNGGAGRQAWSRAPTKSQSLASFRQHVRGRHESFASEGARIPVDQSNLLEQRPARTDSLGAPAYQTPVEPSDTCSARSHTAPSRSSQMNSARQSASSSSFVSPSAGHQRLPSTFLAPSTPSTASFLRSSTSSYDDSLPLNHVFQLREAGITSEPKEINFTDPFRSSEDSTDNLVSHPDEASFTPESYHTASASHEEHSSLMDPPPTARTTQTSASLFPCKNLTQKPPLPSSHGYLRSQASKYSFAQSFTNLQSQGNSVPPTSPSILNGNPFDDIDAIASKANLKDIDHDTNHNTPRSSSIYSERPLLTANLTTTHDISISNSFQQHTRHASDHITGLGITATSSPTSSRRRTVICPFTHDAIITKTPASSHSRTKKPLPPHPPPSLSSPAPSSATDAELELYVTRLNSAQRPSDRLRTSLYVQQNLCTHPKLQSTLGVDLTANPNANKDLKNGVASPSMTMNEVLASPGRGKEKRFGHGIGREGLKGVVKKGSRRFKEGGLSLKERVKAGWRVRGDDFLDEDD